MMMRKWLEPTLLTALLGLMYFIPIQTSPLPIFYGEFNNLDSSLYAVRLFDLFISVSLVIIASRYLIPRHLNPKTLLKISIVLLGIFLAASLLEKGWDVLILNVFNLPTALGEISDKMLANPRRETLSLTILAGNAMALAGGIFYGLVQDRNHQIRQHELLERENLEAEVKYLRSQINPHFLFNTLNNIYAITQRNDDAEGSDALLRLSGLMRYMLYDSTGASIDLQRELDHLRNYMDLMLLKYKADDPPQVDLEIEGNPETCQVAPLILLPFVENAFKHGINNKGQGTIKIAVNATLEAINFSVVNSYFPDRTASADHKGIGLENVKQRLQYLYPEQHHLEIGNTKDEYRVELRINL